MPKRSSGCEFGLGGAACPGVNPVVASLVLIIYLPCLRAFAIGAQTTRFNTNNVAMPAFGSPGNASKAQFYGPGINNFDLSFFKNFPIKESMRVQLRWEMYNAFNHTQFSGVNSTARFNPQGQQINTQFGQITSARDPRIMQGSLRFQF